jgi:hypothetical protein
MPRIAALLACLAVAGAAHAAEWAIERAATLRQSYTDNYFLAPTGRQSAWETSLSPSAQARRATESTVLAASAALTGTLVSGVPDRDSWGASVGLDARHLTERSTYGLAAQFLRDSTFASELRATGVVLARTQRDALSVAPSFERVLTERLSVSLDATASRSDYQDAAALGLQDNRAWSAAAGLGYAAAPRTRLTAALSAQHFETIPATSESDSATLRAGVSHRFSERLSATAGVGYFRARTILRQDAVVCPVAFALCELGLVPFVVVQVGGESRSDGWLFNGTLDWQLGERTSVSAALREDLNPSGAGVLVRTDALTVTLGHRFSDRLSGSVDASGYRSSYVGDSSGRSDSRLYGFGASLSWRAARDWLVEGGARHVRVTYDIAPGADSDATTLFVLVRYDWPPLAVAR